MGMITDWPCDECGAEAGAPCLDNCTLVFMAEVREEAEVIGMRPIEDSLTVIAEVMHKLPYNSLVGARGVGAPELRDYDSAGYLDRLADWLAEYLPIAQAEIDALQAQSRELISVTLERDVLDRAIRRAMERSDA